MLLHPLGHLTQLWDTIVLPQSQFDERRDLLGVMHLTLLGEGNAPTAPGLDPPLLRRRRKAAIAAPVAVRHLIEPTLRGEGLDLHELEEDVWAWIVHYLTPHSFTSFHGFESQHEVFYYLQRHDILVFAKLNIVVRNICLTPDHNAAATSAARKASGPSLERTARPRQRTSTRRTHRKAGQRSRTSWPPRR